MEKRVFFYYIKIVLKLSLGKRINKDYLPSLVEYLKELVYY